jgi:hypothetical protein
MHGELCPPLKLGEVALQLRDYHDQVSRELVSLFDLPAATLAPGTEPA